MEPYGIALIGCGTVGGGVAQSAAGTARAAGRAGRPAARAAPRRRPRPDEDRGPSRCRPSLLTTDLRPVLDDPSIQVVVELVGGIDWAAPGRARPAGGGQGRGHGQQGPAGRARRRGLRRRPAGTAGPSPSRPASPAASRSSPPWRRAWRPTRSVACRASSTAPATSS